MKKEFTSEIHTHNKHLTTQDYHSISECLQRGLNLTDTAKYIHCSVSTIKKIIDRNKILKIYPGKNCCGKKLECNRYNVCGNTNCTHKCSACTTPYVTCNDFCKASIKNLIVSS